MISNLQDLAAALADVDDEDLAVIAIHDGKLHLVGYDASMSGPTGWQDLKEAADQLVTYVNDRELLFIEQNGAIR